VLRRQVGASGLRVSPLILGTLMFGPRGNTDEGECIRMVQVARDAGITAFDTADVYSFGWAEEVLGKAVSGWRAEAVIMTKGGGKMSADPNARGASRRWLSIALEDSLRRLGTDYVDIYFVHRPDPGTALTETLETLTEFIRAGKVRIAGCSTFPPRVIAESHALCEQRNYEKFRCEQPPYSILVREIEADVLPLCSSLGMGVVVWGPLNHGWLTNRPYTAGERHRTPRMTGIARQHDMSLTGNQLKVPVVQRLMQLARDADCSLAQLALAWVLGNPAVSGAVIGPRTAEQLRELLGAPDISLDGALREQIDFIAPPGTSLNPSDADYKALGAAACISPGPPGGARLSGRAWMPAA
jgi:aryl-alcohol dehydrogenase-like predicted oxidoreductase